MSPIKKATTAAERYDVVRSRSRDGRLPPGYPSPQPTAAWPAENVALLERYREWLLSGGASEKQTYYLYVPMAGNALGLNLKPHPEIDIEADLEKALDYVKAKRLSDEWIDMCRNALDKFRRFLRQERGLPPAPPPPPDLSRQQAGLPAWLVEQLTRYQHLMQRNWRPARLEEQIRRFWSSHARLWRWLIEERGIRELRDVRRKQVLDYVDQRLAAGYAVSGINSDLRVFHAFLRFLQDQEFEVPQALFRIPSLKPPDSLPKFLTDVQVCLLRDEIEAQVAKAANPAQERDARLDRAAFYLLWQGGLRLGELEELKLEDLDLAGRRLTVRKGKGQRDRTGKGQRDRTVYLTDTAVVWTWVIRFGVSSSQVSVKWTLYPVHCLL
jgi:site-specific recombinase XerC